MADGACEDQVQPILRGRIEGPFSLLTGKEERVRSLALTARAIGIAMQPDEEGWPKGVLPQKDRDALVKAADLVLDDLRHPFDPPLITHEEVQANLRRARHVEVPSDVPKVVECPLCRAWHRAPACELPV